MHAGRVVQLGLGPPPGTWAQHAGMLPTRLPSSLTYVRQRDLLPGRNVPQRQDHRCGRGRRPVRTEKERSRGVYHSVSAG